MNELRAAVVIGQSNELGAATSSRETAMFGRPCGSINAPSNKPTTWWVGLSENMGRDRGIDVQIHCTAVGGTSITRDWIGTDDGTVNGVLLTEGTGTPGAGVGNYDPNGYLQNALSYLGRPGYTEEWAFISIGQTDSRSFTNQVNYRDGLKAAINHFRTKGIKVAVGLTNYYTDLTIPQGPQWFVDNIVPGYEGALAFFNGDPNVFAGGDLYAHWGLTPPLSIDELHLSQAGHLEAGDVVWTQSLINSGQW